MTSGVSTTSSPPDLFFPVSVTPCTGLGRGEITSTSLVPTRRGDEAETVFRSAWGLEDVQTGVGPLVKEFRPSSYPEL